MFSVTATVATITIYKDDMTESYKEMKLSINWPAWVM